MKTLLIVLLLPYLANGQISLQIRSGYAFNTNEPIIAPAINFAAYGFALSPEMMITYKDNSPAFFGLKMSYEYIVMNDISLQAGYGRYFTLYSMDKYDAYKNGWSNLWLGAVHWRSWFIEYNYLSRNNVLSIGFKENIGRLK